MLNTHNLSTNDARYCIALHPICDRQFKHVADELLYRAHGGALTADITDPVLATARACSTAFYEIGLQGLVGQRLLYLNVSADWLANPDLLPLPVEQVVIELPDTDISPLLWTELKSVYEKGYQISASYQQLSRYGQALLDLINIVKIDVREKASFNVVKQFQESGKLVLASYIENSDLLNMSMNAGCDLLQGFFYGLPQQFQSNVSKRQGNRPADLKLIRLLYDSDTEVSKIESLIAQDPHLCHLLFKRVNSASERRANKIKSISQAVMLLGFEKIRALTATLLLADNQPIKRLMVFKLLVRAHLAKLLASRSQYLEPEVAFTGGLFSMMDQLEGIELQKLLNEAGLDDEIVDGLLVKKGELGKVVKLIESFENAQMEQRSLKQVEALNKDYLASVAWAQEMMALTGD